MRLLVGLFVLLGLFSGVLCQSKKVKPSSKTKEVDYSLIYANEWLKYGESDYVTFFYNPALARKRGNIIKFWTKEIDTEGLGEIRKTQTEVNCSSRKMRNILQVTYMDYNLFYDEKRGQARKYYTISPRSATDPRSTFEEVIPESVGESLVLVICSL